MVTRLVKALMGPHSIVLNDQLRGPGYLRPNPPRIVIRPDTADFREVLAHELSHWVLREWTGFKGSAREEERDANYLATAILAPLDLLRSSHTDLAGDVLSLAGRFGLSRASTVRRLVDVGLHARLVKTTGRRGAGRVTAHV